MCSSSQSPKTREPGEPVVYKLQSESCRLETKEEPMIQFESKCWERPMLQFRESSRSSLLLLGGAAFLLYLDLLT